jgi:hypothetical protein
MVAVKAKILRHHDGAIPFDDLLTNQLPFLAMDTNLQPPRNQCFSFTSIHLELV